MCLQQLQNFERRDLKRFAVIPYQANFAIEIAELFNDARLMHVQPNFMQRLHEAVLKCILASVDLKTPYQRQTPL